MAESQPPLGSSDSIDGQDPNLHSGPVKQKSRRPANTAFRQQRLKAWQPILTPKTVLPLFFAIGIIFAPIGGVLIWASATIQEIVLDYSNCHAEAPLWPDVGEMPTSLIKKTFAENSAAPDLKKNKVFWNRRNITQNYHEGVNVPSVNVDTIQCTINFTIPNEMSTPVLFYYRLTKFYQNHRRYAKSFNIDQLSGTAVSADSIHRGDCTPLTTETIDGVRKAYYPCGLAPNSVFNDTFFSPLFLNDNVTYVMQNRSDISWGSDRELYGPSKYNWTDVLVPPNWRQRYPNGYSEEYHPDLENDQAFQVWMRLAGLPTFSKLAQRNDTVPMKAGEYSLNINHHFDVTEYGGTKSIVISNSNVMGGKNNFLGIAYVVVGGICILLGVLFTVTHLIKPRKLGDHTYLSWNNEQPSTATTSGREGGGIAESRA